MESGFWHMKHDFLNTSPRDIVRGIIEDDKNNYARAKAEFSEEIKLLDDALALFVMSLQGGYRIQTAWENNISVKASVVMANAMLNQLFLARHAVMLGYFAECHDLLRSFHERVNCCAVFFNDEDEAKHFFDGAEIWPRDVRKKLSSFLAEGNDVKRDEILKILKDSYNRESKIVHPNLESLRDRTGGPKTEDLKDRVVKYPFWGGMLSYDLGKPIIFIIIQATLLALKIIGVIFEENSGVWKKEFSRIKETYETFLAEARKSPT
jgi:hypothetical protein